jgi:ATP-dependent exoDNAse (exonuclease V) beta subunit
MGPAAGLPADRRILTGGALGEVMNEAMRQVIDHVADTPDDPDREHLRRLLAALGRRDLVEHLAALIERRARSVPWAREMLQGAGADPAAISAAVSRLRGRQPAPVDEEAREQHALQVSLARLFERLLARYRELLVAARACDFRQLLEDVAAAFENEAVRRRWASRFRHVLVDEFQDTDPLQWEVLRKLFGEGRIERPGLFVVGDEKQAIFSFRDGDVSTFQDAGREIAEAGGAELSLVENYRSTPRLVGFFNRVSETLFAEGGGGDARHQAMAPAREWKPETLAGLETRIEVLIGRGEDGAAARASEFQAVAAAIRRFADGSASVWDKAAGRMRPATLDDQAILLRTRASLPALEAVLTGQGIPFRVLGGVGFYDQHEVRALCDLMRFLADEQDDLALVGVLRSALFAIPDSVLLAAVRSPSAGSLRVLWPKVTRLAAAVRSGEAVLPTPSDAPVLLDAVGRLERWRRLADRLPSNELLALAVRESDLVLTLDVVDPSGRSSANVEKLLDLARRCRAEGLASLDELERTIALARVDADTPEAQADPPAAGRDAVSILTVHAAKGLEWPIVFVPATDTGVLQRRTEKSGSVPARLRDLAAPFFLHEVDTREDGDDDASPLHEALKDLANREKLAESRRLLYVALTRARDHLVISGAAAGDAAPGGKRESWLGWLLPALDPSIPVLDPAPAGSARARAPHPMLVAGPKRRAGGVAVQGMLPFEEAADAPPPGRPVSDVVVPATALASLRVCPRRFHLEHVLGVPAERREAGGGPDGGLSARVRGTIVHGALEGLASGLDPVARVRGVAARFGLRGEGDLAALEAHVRKAVAGLAAWPVGRAILEAPAGSVRCEVPFELGAPRGGARVAGAIDLLHEVPGGGSVVVDFKTDSLRGDAREIAANHGYLDQLEAYAAAVAGARPGPVRAWLFFTSTGTAVPVVGETGTSSAEAAAAKVAKTLASIPAIAAAGFPLTTDAGACSACPHRGHACPGVGGEVGR